MEQTSFYHPRLNAHKAIGVDIDSTLIEGPCSFYLQRWVQQYHKDIELHLVTFRVEDDFDAIERDIGTYGMQLDMFHGVHGIPLDVANDFYKLTAKVGMKGQVNEAKWKRTLAYHNTSEEQYESTSTMVKKWKGLKCRELGLTALIDDLEDMVVPGCLEHGIEWINALTLTKDYYGK